MGERRQVHRREPIEVELDDGRIFIARPLPWLTRNDLGSEILRQNTEAVNDAVRIYADPDTNILQLEARLQEKLTDPWAVLKIGYPENKAEDFQNIDYGELIELLVAMLEVNHLEHVRQLVDPNFQSPMPNGGIPSSAEGNQVDGLKIESSLSSSSSDSVENPSSL